MTTGELIRKARKAAGLTQIELGKLMNMTAQNIGKYERNLSPPKIKTLANFASALGVDPGSLITPEDINALGLHYQESAAPRTVGETIKLARCAAGLTQKELGEKCGLADSAIRKYEAGKIEPKLLLRLRLAAVLGIALSDLMSPEECELLGSIENSKTGGANHATKRILRGQCTAAERVFPSQGVAKRGRRCQVRRARPANRRKALPVYQRVHYSGNAGACAMPPVKE